MSNPTLINGFEDVLTFISQQAERIKKLEAQNKELKATSLRWQERAQFTENFAQMDEDSDGEYNSDGEPLDKSKYDGDDWAYGYGFSIKNGEYRINMCGGCREWFDYVITKNGCFIHNKDGMEKVRTFISCPDGDYIKVVAVGELYPDTPQGEGETDMFNMVKECFTEQIMEYEEQ